MKRYRNKNPQKQRDYEESLAATYFEGGKYAEALDFYKTFLADARKQFKAAETAENRNKVLAAMRRLAESEEMGSDPQKAVPLWNEFSTMTFKPAPEKEWFEARYHLANAYYRLKQPNAAKDVIKRVEVLYGGFGADEELAAEVKELKKNVGYP